ncbi:MAG TPA: 30S ribosomal protein S16 [Candidatus Limnocylindrales bacterium]|nr:30S ribosomal protein S16 [Candidatus Limnocylindrales bacterium]
MLAIRMQRTGRKGHAQFRIIVQEARRTPTSGAIVAQLGSFNPHAKQIVLDKEKAGFYLEHGAQPSDRVARLFQKEGIKLPAWVKLAADKSRTIRHPEKLRQNQPAAPAAEPADEPAAAEPADAATNTVADEPTQTDAAESVAPGTEETPAAEAADSDK